MYSTLCCPISISWRILARSSLVTGLALGGGGGGRLVCFGLDGGHRRSHLLIWRKGRLYRPRRTASTLPKFLPGKGITTTTVGATRRASPRLGWAGRGRETRISGRDSRSQGRRCRPNVRPPCGIAAASLQTLIGLTVAPLERLEAGYACHDLKASPIAKRSPSAAGAERRCRHGRGGHRRIRSFAVKAGGDVAGLSARSSSRSYAASTWRSMCSRHSALIGWAMSACSFSRPPLPLPP